MRKIIAAIRYLLRKRLSISDSLFFSSIRDIEICISPDEISDYNTSVENDNFDNFTTQIHPVFLSKISWNIIENLNELLTDKIDNKLIATLVHAAEYYRFYQQIPLNSKLQIKSEIWQFKPHKKGTSIVLKLTCYHQEQLVAESFSKAIMFGVKCIGEGHSHGDTPASALVEESVTWQKSIQIDEDLPYLYAKKAIIDAPIHTDPEYAKSIGLPDNILQGTCTFAKAVGVVLSEEAEGSDSDIESVSAKFTGFVTLPNKLLVRFIKRHENTLYFDVMDEKNHRLIKGGQIKLSDK